MIKITNKEIFINHYEEINENINILKKLFEDRIESDSKLKGANYEEFMKLESNIKKIKTIKEKYTIKDIIDFYEYTQFILKLIYKFPRKIEKLEKSGYSVSSYTPKQILENSIIYDETYYKLKYFFPDIQEYLPIATKIKNNIDFIILAQDEAAALNMRKTIGIPPIIYGTNIVQRLMQRHGAIPVSNFKKMTKPKSYIYLNVNNPVYFTSVNIYNTYDDIQGVTIKYIENTVYPVEMDIKAGKTGAVNLSKNTNIFYETFDNKYYRKMKCKNIENIIRGPSHIANGYNNIFNKKIIKYLKEPYIERVSIEQIRNLCKQYYTDIVKKIRGKKDLITAFIEAVEKAIFKRFTDIPKIILKDIKMGLICERAKLSRKIIRLEPEQFYEEIIDDKHNFILRIERKIKAYNRIYIVRN